MRFLLLIVNQIFLPLQESCFVLNAQHFVSSNSIYALVLYHSPITLVNVAKAELGLQCFTVVIDSLDGHLKCSEGRVVISLVTTEALRGHSELRVRTF